MDIIDINVYETTEVVDINVTPNLTIVNINKTTNVAPVTSVNGQVGDVILTIPAEQVNSDWNATLGKAVILNKPSIPSITGLATVTYVDTQDALKVDKITGKGLSTNDFTNTLKTKLDGIQDGAEVNVNADWNATSGDAQILNKPTIPSPSTLDNVLTNGNTSLLDAKVGTLGLWDTSNSYYNKIGSIGNAFYFMRNDGAALFVTEAGYSRFSTDYGTLELSNAGIIGTKTINWPDASGTVALTSDIIVPTLDSVLTNGNSSQIPALVGSVGLWDNPNAGYGYLSLTDGLFIISDYNNTTILSIDYDNIIKSNPDTGLSGTLNFTGITISRVYTLPDENGEIALKSNIPTYTSQLTNNGSNGTNPFITALDIPTSGQAGSLVREVKNMTGATLTKGTVVYISGANGNKALVSKAQANAESSSARTFGLLQSDILNNGLGNCVIIGDLSGLNTSTFTEGAQLYLSGTVAGAYTDVKTLAPTHLVYIGKITRSHPTQGQIEVAIQNGYELDEIHDVSIISKTNNDIIQYDSTDSLWKNRSLSAAGIQPTLTLTTIGSSGSATLIGNTLNIPQYSGGGGGGVTPVKLTSQTLSVASWTLVSGYYTYTFNNVNVTTTCDVEVTPRNSSYLTAYNAQVLPFVGVATGVATFYSQFPPQSDIIVDILITQTT